MPAPIDSDTFRSGMRRLAGAVTLVTTQVGDEYYGLIATAVSSVSASPPSLLVCVNRQASAHDVIDQVGYLAVNILGGEDIVVAELFRNGAPRDGRFSVLSWVRLETGAPVLSTSLFSFDCTIATRVRHHSHTIFICDVVGACAGERDSTTALLYANNTFHTLNLGTVVKPLPS